MLKKLLIMVCAFAMSAALSSAGTITWGCTDLGWGTGDGWLVILVEDTSADGIDDIYLSGDLASLVFTDTGTMDIGDDDVTGNTTTLLSGKGGNPYYGSSFNTVETGGLEWGDSVYTIILNSDQISTATQYVIVDSDPFQTPGDDSDTGYVLPGDEAGSWQNLNAVPEPGTMGLMALGLAIVGLRRRKS